MAGAAIVAALLVAAAIAGSAAPGRAGQRRQGLPVATNTILANPDAYYGKLVTVSAGVDAMLSKTVFLVDQWKALGTEEAVPMGKPILVIAPYLSAALEHRQYFLLRGQVIKFDPAAIAARRPRATRSISRPTCRRNTSGSRCSWRRRSSTRRRSNWGASR